MLNGRNIEITKLTVLSRAKILEIAKQNNYCMIQIRYSCISTKKLSGFGRGL